MYGPQVCYGEVIYLIINFVTIGKIISIQKGTYIPGGIQIFGKFNSLKSCMKACGVTAICFAGDYDPWLGKCYLHGKVSACSPMSSHKKITHFKKVPCSKHFFEIWKI